MMRKLAWFLVAAVALLMTVPAFPCDQRMDADGENCFFSDRGGIDLSELADGETRYFGPREREVAVTRVGDDIVMTLSGDDGETHEVKCELEDGCFLLTNDGDEGASVLMMSSRGAHGHGNGHGPGSFVFRGDDGALPDDGKVLIEMLAAGDNEFVFGGSGLQWVSEGGEDHNQFIQRLHQSGTQVRCPEGDTTMRLEEGESAEDYYCPRHNVLMEKVEHRFGNFEVKIDRHEDKD
jgi:hypothetical protein